MAVWETEDESSSVVAASLPSPMDLPYRTPSRSSRSSRKSRRRSVTPPGTQSSPPPMPSDKSDRTSKRVSRDISMDESISILDPRRFTPTLHATLISEILMLRKSEEDKLKHIESLENALQATRDEYEADKEKHAATSKENRSIKRQLGLLEGGTSSAFDKLGRERDEAVENLAEMKKRLETAQKKIRSQDEDSERVHKLWAKEKDAWDQERRNFERKIHVAETRLKSMVDEVATIQAAQANGANAVAESEAEDTAKENDATSIRSMSMTNSVRYSVLSGKLNGHSLADELNDFDDDDYETDPDGRQSVISNRRHYRNQSRDSTMSMSPSKSHRRNMSTDSQRRPASVARGRLFMNQTVLDRLEGGIREDDETQDDEPTLIAIVPKPEYKDADVQYSPPPSPKLTPTKPKTPEPIIRAVDVESPPRADMEIEANQRRKRVHPVKVAVAPLELPVSKPLVSTVSTASQTVDQPLSPPRTPTTTPPSPVMSKPVPIMTRSVATQTDDMDVSTLPPPLQQPTPVSTLPIPTISIIPPASRPATPREHRLPQYVKDFGCQVSIAQSVATTSIGVQTDEIRVDKRLDKLPPHLHPSAVSSRPTSPAPKPASNAATHPATLEDANQDHFTPLPSHLPPRNPRRLAGHKNVTDLPSSPPVSPVSPGFGSVTRDAYPGNNDDGPLSSQKAPLRRPHRISSLFAGFDAASSDEGDEFGDGDVSDGEFRTALSAPKHQSIISHHSKRGSSATNSTIERATIEQAHTAVVAPRQSQSRNSMKSPTTETYSSFSLENRKQAAVARPGEKPSMNSMHSASHPGAGAMRKSAMIQSGIATHQNLPSSPGIPESRNPPFPIPTRASSRQPENSASAPSDGRRSPVKVGDGWRRGVRNGPYRSNSIRKARSSAAVLSRNQRHRRQGSRSPPPFEDMPESPELPPLPTNDITTPRRDRGGPRSRGHRSQPSTTTANTENTNQDVGSVNSTQQASHVVDAIAQTMVGEWMYKYVRRRKSFSMGETKADDTSNDRHKRWVWLAPYERAILWSSKQPTSGSALLGKSGRKLIIQSVLDVKDNNPAPKGAELFNHSILILTPQRALKFTATSSERHYMWLSSLSFLAHSQQEIPQIISQSNKQSGMLETPKALPNFGPPPPKTNKRPGIRDSIMLKKGKNVASNQQPPGNVISASQFEDSLVFNKPSESFAPMANHNRDFSRDVAEPPLVPRYQDRPQDRVHERANQVVLHGRKRSNTGGHIPPPLSFRGFSGPVGHGGSYHAPTNSTAGNSVGTTGSSDIYSALGSSNGNTWAMSTAGSQRTSEASSRPTNNIFEAIGTVRMEAFISPLAFPRVNEYPDETERYRARRRSKEIRRRRSRSRHRDSYNSRTTRGTDDWYGGSRTAGEEDYFRDDPFKGF